MLSLRTNYRLKDLSQGSRIAYVRHFRGMTQHNLADKLGVKHDNKRRIMTRYEKGERNPKEDRTKEIAKILNVSYSSIKQYDFKDINDIFFILMWMEELYPNFGFKMDLPNNNKFNNALLEWNNMRIMKNNKSITYEQYLNWKLSYEIDDCR